MNMPLSRHPYWGQTADHRALLKQIAEIGPQLDANAEGDARGELSPESFALLEPLRLGSALVSEAMGGMQLPPTQVIELLEAVTYHSGSAGWVSMVHAGIGAMSAAFLPDAAVERLYNKGTDHRFSGLGAPMGMLKKVEGGYRLSGKWGFGSGFSHATYTHSGCFIDDGTGKPLMEDGAPVVMCAHAPIPEHTQIGNWDVMGLKGTGSIDYTAEDVFIPEDLVYRVIAIEAQRQKELNGIGLIGIASLGHTSWAMGASRRMLDEIAGFARTKSGRAGLLGESEKFWFDYGRAEASVRAARAFAMEVWGDIEAMVERGETAGTREVSLIHLAKSEVHEAGESACNFAYRAAGSAGLRRGVIQRVFRDMMVAVNHITIAPHIVANAGREVGGLWTDRTWQLYDLVPNK
ncbi:acyl-CoA dehydrogenase [Paracoccus sp. S-4012]|uniref:acyl-CoA dehydrogenase family protein n=1 Tax=Paracoccus sp. S-4012 TaxID=2665648 RepID=UPI0012B13322|nr:acyl-CoA dehydrogenase family protein [Paracoccus sp. S-4012]MRX50381.1 acyl-CoA dehydrogenase [Paracoccus sp. S-4012]